jgi:hypothetical protein
MDELSNRFDESFTVGSRRLFDKLCGMRISGIRTYRCNYLLDTYVSVMCEHISPRFQILTTRGLQKGPSTETCVDDNLDRVQRKLVW